LGGGGNLTEISGKRHSLRPRSNELRKAKKKGLMNESFNKKTKEILTELNKILESGSGDFVHYLDSLEAKFEISTQGLHGNSSKLSLQIILINCR